MHIGFTQLPDKLGICRGERTPRTTLSFRTSPQTGVGISIEFQAAHRHTGVLTCHFPKFIHEKWCFYPGDCHTSDIGHWFAMTGSSIPHPSVRQISIYRAGCTRVPGWMMLSAGMPAYRRITLVWGPTVSFVPSRVASDMPMTSQSASQERPASLKSTVKGRSVLMLWRMNNVEPS